MKSLIPFAALLTFLSPALSAQDNPHRLSFSLSATEPLNDDPGIGLTTFKPFLNYRYQPDPFRLSLTTAGLYNRLDLFFGLDQDLQLNVGHENLITLAGDEPRVDGVENGIHKFKAHRFTGYVGANAKSIWQETPLSSRVAYEVDLFQTYEKSPNASFVAPSSTYDHGPLLRVQMGSSDANELKDYGVRVLHLSSFRIRSKHQAWGDASLLRKVKNYYRGSLGAAMNFEVADWAVAVVKAQGSLVSKADRLNALGDLNFQQEVIGMTYYDLKTDRAATVEAGLRVLPNNSKRLAFRPYGHAVTYRELTPTHFRTNSGMGGGVKLMGQWGENFSWDIGYANLYGTRKNISGIHQVRGAANYRFF